MQRQPQGNPLQQESIMQKLNVQGWDAGTKNFDLAIEPMLYMQQAMFQQPKRNM